MPNVRLGSDRYQFYISHWFDLTGNPTPDLSHARLALYRIGYSGQVCVCVLRHGLEGSVLSYCHYVSPRVAWQRFEVRGASCE